MAIQAGDRANLFPSRARPAGSEWMSRGRVLVAEWKAMFRPSTIPGDILAGISVALVALPFALAIADASGVPPVYGLVTAVLSGILVPLVGGSRFQVSGPTASLTFLVYEIVTRFGMGGLAAVLIIAGLLQIAAGILGMGRFISLLPRPVVAGFLSGIGLTIFLTQLPVILGYDIRHTDEGGALGILFTTMRGIPNANVGSLIAGLIALFGTLYIPRITRRLSAPLIAIVLASIVPLLFGWTGLQHVGALPTSFPPPRLPVVPWDQWNELVMAALAIFVLASLESLLTAAVVDSLVEGHRTDNDQELIGQGIGNFAVAFFGGLPIAGVMSRSATNVTAGGRTRLACIAQALALLAMVMVSSGILSYIPRAALAGVLAAVALRMIEVRLFRVIWRASRVEAVVGLTTAGAILITDLIVGVPIGILAAFLYIVYEMSRLDVRSVSLNDASEASVEDAASRCNAVQLIEVNGPLFFASGYHLRSALGASQDSQCVILDLDRVPFLDLTGVEILEETVDLMRRRGIKVLLARPSRAVVGRLRELTQHMLPALRGCAIYEDLRDAFLDAACSLEQGKVCAGCRSTSRCAAIDSILNQVDSPSRTAVPRVRAVVPWDPQQGPENGPVHRLAGTIAATDDGEHAASSIRPGPVTSWNQQPAHPVIAPTAYVDPHSVVIGSVTLGEDVYLGPSVSVRADEGTPFHIGDRTNVQDGVTLHALKGKVVLVRGNAYAIYVGKNVSLTHHCLVHGPCFIGDDCFIGFKAIVHDAVVGAGCVVGLGAVVVGVTLAPNRYVPHNMVVDTQEKADELPDVTDEWTQLRDEVVEVNHELAAGHRAPRPRDARNHGDHEPIVATI